MPTLNAFVPELVTRDEIQSAIAVDRAVFHGSRVVGPSLAGIFIGAWGAASAFLQRIFVRGTDYRFIHDPAALAAARPRKNRSAPVESRKVFATSRKTNQSLAMIGLIAATTVFIFPIITVMMPLYVRLVLHLGANQLGF